MSETRLKVELGVTLDKQFPGLLRHLERLDSLRHQRNGPTLRPAEIPYKIFELTKLFRQGIAGYSGLPRFLEAGKGDQDRVPDKELPKEVITWAMVRREPAATGGAPFGRDAQELKPRIREAPMKLIGEDYTLYEIRSQFWDTLYQFNLWTFSDYEADTFADWFEEFLSVEANTYLQQAGVQQSYVYSRFVDHSLDKYKATGYKNRSLLFYARTDTQHLVSKPVIRAVRTIAEIKS